MRNKRTIFYSAILLSLYVFFQASTSLFPHTHIVDGRVVAHSHPSGNSGHTHTASQITTLALVSSFSSLQPEVGQMPLAACALVPEVREGMVPEKPEDGFAPHIFLRGPPSSAVCRSC